MVCIVIRLSDGRELEALDLHAHGLTCGSRGLSTVLQFLQRSAEISALPRLPCMSKPQQP